MERQLWKTATPGKQQGRACSRPRTRVILSAMRWWVGLGITLLWASPLSAAETAPTPLHAAVKQGKTGSVAELLAGADLEARDEYRHTPLSRAKAKQERGVVTLLQTAGAKR